MTKTRFDSLTDKEKIFAGPGLQILRGIQLLRSDVVTEVEATK